MNRASIEAEIALRLDRLKRVDASDETILRSLTDLVEEMILPFEKEIERLNKVVTETKHII